MLCSKNFSYPLFTRVISLILVVTFVASDIAFAAPDLRSASSCLAPPLATKPTPYKYPGELTTTENPDGPPSVDLVTNKDTIEHWAERSQGFHNEWGFVDLSYLIGQMLYIQQKLPPKNKLVNPAKVLIPLIWKHIKNRNGEEEMRAAGYDIDGIKEVKSSGGELAGFILPIKKDGAVVL